MQPFMLLIKPSGSDCNLDCTYCFYKNRAPQIGSGRQRMGDEVLDVMTKGYLSLRFDLSTFSWQGGEPLLMGLDFYKRAVELQKKYCSESRQIANSIQTNGILLDEQWCDFFRDNLFLVGISHDGPKEFHDYYRKDFSGKGTYEKVIKAIRLCRDREVEFNVLVLLTRKNGDRPDELIDFFLDNGVKYLQFIPCIEVDDKGRVEDFSITPQQYGDFLCKAFDRWLKIGPLNLSIRDFESIVTYAVTGQHTICTFQKKCCGYVVVEHNGDVFVCDFFVDPKWRLGNLLQTSIKQLAVSSKKLEFDRAKMDLSDKCLMCRYLDVCRGGCQKDKIANSNVKLSYFCESYKRFFDYAMPRLLQLSADVKTRIIKEARQV